MQRKQGIVLAIAVCFAGLPFATLQAADESAVEVDKLLTKLNAAFEKNDTQALRELMADDKVAITPYYDGPQNKDQQLKSLTDFKFSEFKPGQRAISAISKEVILVTYPLAQKGTFQGRPMPSRVHVTSLWVSRAGKWQEVLYQETIQAERK